MIELEVIWSDFSERQLDEISEYYKEEASLDVALKLIGGILNEPKIIWENPWQILNTFLQ